MINSFIFLPANFTLATEIKQQTTNAHIAAVASMRLNFLSQEIRVINGGWSFPLLQLFLIVRILSPWIRDGINWAAEKTSDAVVDSIAEKIDRGLTACEETMDRVIAHLDPLIMAAATITYIALFALGHMLIAAIGLTSIALIALQRFGYLPTPVAKILEPLGLLSILTISIITPAPLIIRILCIAMSAMDLIEYACRFFPTQNKEDNVCTV